MSEAVSPNGQLVATVFERDCGATTAKNTQVSLRWRAEVFDYEKQPSFLIFQGSGDVQLSWEDATNLVVRAPSGAKVFRSERTKMGITIQYRQ
jgi:hypothetical protein